MSNCEELSIFTKLAWIGAQSVYGKFLTTATETRNIGIGLSMSFPFEECPVWPTPFLFECKHYQSLDRVPHASLVVRGTFYQLTIWLDWTILNHCLVARRQSFARIDCYHLNDTCVFYQFSKLPTDWQTTFGWGMGRNEAAGDHRFKLILKYIEYVWICWPFFRKQSQFWDKKRGCPHRQTKTTEIRSWKKAAGEVRI